MPNCFSLTRKSEPDKGPVALNQIDAEMCKHFGVDVHEKQYCMSWFDIIGFKLACGKTFEQAREDERKLITEKTSVQDVFFAIAMIGIADWLEANFVPSSWVEIGKR